jgi:hypothetical protein
MGFLPHLHSLGTVRVMKEATPRLSVAMLMARCGARVASQQSPTLRNGTFNYIHCPSPASISAASRNKQPMGVPSRRMDGKHRTTACRRLLMLLAQCDESQGFGDGLPAQATLKRLLRQVETAFPNARALRRPGFDATDEQVVEDSYAAFGPWRAGNR